MSRGGWRRIAFGALVALLGAAALPFWPRSPELPPPPPATAKPPVAPAPARGAGPTFPAKPAPAPVPEAAVPAPPPKPGGKEPVYGPRGDLVFRVVAAESGEPLPEPSIRDRRWEGRPGDDADPAVGEVVLPAEGDLSGRIRIRGCAAVRQSMTVTAPGRAPREFDVVVAEGRETEAPDVPLEKEARIRCRVLDDEGKPRGGVVLKVENELIFGRTLAEATTDEDGAVVLDGLPGGILQISDRKGPGDSSLFVAAAPGATAEVVLGGRPQLEVLFEGAKANHDALILLPLGPGLDPLLIGADELQGIPSGTRILESKEPEKGRFLVGGLAPGRWFVGPESPPCSAIVDVPAESVEPIRMVLKPGTVRVRIRSDSAAGGSSLTVDALREGDAEAALAGDPEALLRLLVGSFDNRSSPIEGLLSEIDVVTPGEGACVLFFRGGALCAEPLRVAAAKEAPVDPHVVDLVPGTLLRVKSRAVEERKAKEGDQGTEEGATARRWHDEKHLAAARDATGRVRALRLQDGDVELRLPPGRWRIEFRGPSGFHRTGEVDVPETGEAEFLVE